MVNTYSWTYKDFYSLATSVCLSRTFALMFSLWFWVSEQKTIPKKQITVIQEKLSNLSQQERKEQKEEYRKSSEEIPKKGNKPDFSKQGL